MTTAPVTPPVGPPSTDPPRPARPAAKAVAILTVALGAVAIVATAASSIVPTVAASASSPGPEKTSTLAVDGVERLRLEAGASRFTLRFDDVEEASLQVRDNGRGAWIFDRDGDELRVESPRGFSWSWFGRESEEVVLVLPEELAGVDADIDFGAGSLDADGDFGLLDLELGAGEASLAGSARELSVTLGAGRADVDLADVDTARFDVNAGSVAGRLTGSTPTNLSLGVSAGSLELEVPDDVYAVTSDVAAGGFDNGLRVADSSRHTIEVTVAAGDVTLRSE